MGSYACFLPVKRLRQSRPSEGGSPQVGARVRKLAAGHGNVAVLSSPGCNSVLLLLAFRRAWSVTVRLSRVCPPRFLTRWVDRLESGVVAWSLCFLSPLQRRPSLLSATHPLSLSPSLLPFPPPSSCLPLLLRCLLLSLRRLCLLRRRRSSFRSRRSVIWSTLSLAASSVVRRADHPSSISSSLSLQANFVRE